MGEGANMACLKVDLEIVKRIWRGHRWLWCRRHWTFL